jgi:ATP-dependent DNA helicase PIF1
MGGCTSHSRLKIPIAVDENSFCSIKRGSLEAELIQQTSLLIYDEITMQHRHCQEAFDRTCRDIRDSDMPFGGLTVVFGGDFQQILPVIVKGSRPEIVNASIRSSYIWSHLKILSLKLNMRLGQNPEEANFAKWQLEVGHGQHTDEDANITLPPYFHCPHNTVESLIDSVYPGISHLPHPPDHYFTERCILSARNDDVDHLNEKILNDFPGEERVYLSADSIKEDTSDPEAVLMYPTEYLNMITASGLPLHKLTLKVGSPVMVLRNLNPAEGVCNGTRGIITRMTNRVLELRLLGGDHNGQLVFLPRIKCYPSNAQIPFQLCRLQFCVRNAFSMSVNKAQGQSLKYVGLDFHSPVFTHGQFYVAVSRATSVNRIKAIWDPKFPNPVTKNHVFPEVLLDLFISCLQEST